MASKHIAQIRYFGDTNKTLNEGGTKTGFAVMSENEPLGLTSLDLTSGSVFNSYASNGGIIQLGVQALPGTKFNLNSNLDPIIIGTSGMYELDLTNSSAVINKIWFDDESLDKITDNPDGYLIIDMVYWEV